MYTVLAMNAFSHPEYGRDIFLIKSNFEYYSFWLAEE